MDLKKKIAEAPGGIFPRFFFEKISFWVNWIGFPKKIRPARYKKTLAISWGGYVARGGWLNSHDFTWFFSIDV